MKTLERIGQTDDNPVVKAVAEYLAARLTLSS